MLFINPYYGKWPEWFPAFGDVFSAEVKNYDFWGHCDMDVIFGKVRSFMTADLLNKYDIITTRKKLLVILLYLETIII
jgi:hypothetical protein